MGQKLSDVILDFNVPNLEASHQEGWPSYFENLAMPKMDPTYSTDMMNAATIIHLLHSLYDDSHDNIKTIREEDTKQFVNQLRKGKAADTFRVTAEHIQYASTEVITILTKVINSIHQTGDSGNQGLGHLPGYFT